MFDDLFEERFTARASGGKEVPLIPQGENVPVTFDNRLTYVNLVREFRLHEQTPQCQALVRGLATIVPVHLLRLFTWQEVETQVTGTSDVDLALLQANTVYKQTSASAPHVQYFWQALESFDAEERCAFLRFVWGRSRLPGHAASFPRNFTIKPLVSDDISVDPNQYLPIAHTCFFSIDLPLYTSAEAAAEKLRYAIMNCLDIDKDTIQVEEWSEDDDDDRGVYGGH